MLLSFGVDHLKRQPLWLALPTFLGFLVLLKHIVIRLLNLINLFIIRKLKPPLNLVAAYGSWAVVTGATDGIGKAIALQLAGKGLNLVLLGRNPGKLAVVSDEIRAKFAETKTKTVVLDFCDGGGWPEGARRLEEAVEGLDVGILVNNAGVTYPAARFFHEVEERVWRNVVKVNVKGTTRVTRALLPGILRNRRGTIVNIGSGSAIVVPSYPLFTVYAASKAYLDQFSKSLNVEYKHLGIQVQCQVPLYVATRMVEVKKPSLFVPSAEEYAKAAVGCIGREEGRCMPYWPHALQWYIVTFFSEAILDFWRLSIAIRRRATASN